MRRKRSETLATSKGVAGRALSRLPNGIGAANTLGMSNRPSPSPVGVRIREARELAGISARELDRLAGLSENHTSLLESVVRDVRAETAVAVARALGVSLDWLLVGAGRPPTARAVRAAIDAARAKT